MTVQDSLVDQVRSGVGSQVTLSNSVVGRWVVGGAGTASESRIGMLELEGSSESPIQLKLEGVVIGTLQSPESSSGRMFRALISCSNCRIDDSIKLRDVALVLEGEVLFLVPQRNVALVNSRLIRRLPVVVTDDEGDPLAGIPLGLRATGASDFFALAESDDSGGAVFELHFEDSNWSRAEVLTTTLGTVDVEERITLLSSSPLVLSIPRAALTGDERDKDDVADQSVDLAAVTVTTPTIIRRSAGGLRRGATISGRVTSAATELPLVGVHMVADPTEDGSSADGETDGDGRYTLTGLAPGTYTVRAEGNGNNHGHLRTFYDGRLSRHDARQITLGISEDVTAIDFDLELGASLAGTVTDAETGLPIGDVNLSAGPVGENHVTWSGTNSTGRYTMNGLPGGVAVEVEVDGQDYISARVVVLTGEAGTRQSASFVLERGTTISGRVVDADTGLSISKVDIQADNVDREGPNAYTTTDSRGAYTLRGVAPGTYRIEVNWNPYGYIREYYDGKTSWGTADFLTVSGDGPITGVDFSLGMGASISGRVIDEETGLPIANVDIGAEDVDGNRQGSYTSTNSDGTYTLTGVASGIYRVWTNHDSQGYVKEYYDGESNWDRANIVNVEGSQPVQGIDFALAIGAAVSGTVFDSDTGLPIANVGIAAGPAGGNPWSGRTPTATAGLP